MRLYTVKRNDTYELAVAFAEDSAMYLLAENGFAFCEMQQLIDAWDDTLKQGLYALKGTGKVVEADKITVCAPIVHPRQDLICLGINYYAHAKEAAGFSKEAFGGERPAPFTFPKDAVMRRAAHEQISAYEGLVDSLDYEVELAAVLGKEVKGIAKEDALQAVFGYTIVNDISARNLQTAHTQWYLGKSLDGFAPIGPCIVTADEIPDPQCLDIKCYVNGELRQDSNTGLQMQTVAGAISELSQGMTLTKGTIIATGTPAGVGMGFKPLKFLHKGDKIRCEIEKIGVLENKIGE